MKILMVIAVALVTLLAVAIGYIYWQNSQVPELGHTGGQFTPLSGNPNGVSTQSSDAKTLVEPWPFKTDQSETMQAIRNAISAYGDAEVVQQDADYLRVVFVTPGMRFRDDAEFYLDFAAREVHFRSESRAGKSDMGLNRQRHEQLTELYLR